MAFRKYLQKIWAAYQALPTRKKILYVSLFVIYNGLCLVFVILDNQLQNYLEPLAARMNSIPGAWLLLGILIAIACIPPLFGHAILALVAGYVYGSLYGFLLLTISSLIGEYFVYAVFPYLFLAALERLREKHAKNYGVFVAVVEDGGVVMIWFIMMSVIPTHISTPFFGGLRTITWYKLLFANILASPVKFFPPVYVGTLLRSKSNNGALGNVVFTLCVLVTLIVMWQIRKSYKVKKAEYREMRMAEEAIAEKRTGDVTDIEELDASEVCFERNKETEMTFMCGRTREDNRWSSGWPFVNAPSKVHLKGGKPGCR